MLESQQTPHSLSVKVRYGVFVAILISHPHREAMGCLLWRFWRNLTMFWWHHSVWQKASFCFCLVVSTIASIWTMINLESMVFHYSVCWFLSWSSACHFPIHHQWIIILHCSPRHRLCTPAPKNYSSCILVVWSAFWKYSLLTLALEMARWEPSANYLMEIYSHYWSIMLSHCPLSCPSGYPSNCCQGFGVFPWDVMFAEMSQIFLCGIFRINDLGNIKLGPQILWKS